MWGPWFEIANHVLNPGTRHIPYIRDIPIPHQGFTRHSPIDMKLGVFAIIAPLLP